MEGKSKGEKSLRVRCTREEKNLLGKGRALAYNMVGISLEQAPSNGKSDAADRVADGLSDSVRLDHLRKQRNL
jgi:hypothetical protein